MTFLDRTIPNGDRDDAPQLALDTAPIAPSPPLNDETCIARLARLTRHFSDAQRYLFEAHRALPQRDYTEFHAAMKLAEEHMADCRSLAARLADPRTSRATKE